MRRARMLRWGRENLEEFERVTSRVNHKPTPIQATKMCQAMKPLTV